MIQIIQFPHPIWEDSKTINGIKPWNNEAHKRNFIVSPGEAITAKGTPPQHFDSISFWGEWEPEAKVVKTFAKANSPIMPRRLIAPMFPGKMPKSSGINCCANTDPFVFGEHFKYSNCRQLRNGMPNRLQDLAAGSLILFGGIFQGEFWLDTVFVVKDGGDKFVANRHQPLQSILNADYPLFEKTTLKPLASSSGSSSFTLYQGQTYWENENYFSFVPCDVDGNAFAKVKLTQKIVSKLSANGRNYTILGEPQKDGSNPQAIWNKIADYVLSQGLSLGVRFDNVAPSTGTV